MSEAKSVEANAIDPIEQTPIQDEPISDASAQFGGFVSDNTNFGAPAGTQPGQGVVDSVETVHFAPLPQSSTAGEQNSMDLLLDVDLDLSVELGRTSIPVRDILQLGSGSIVELEKSAGDPVDIMINGKLIARGEVVVVDENFGVRVTEVISRTERLNKLS